MNSRYEMKTRRVVKTECSLLSWPSQLQETIDFIINIIIVIKAMLAFDRCARFIRIGVDIDWSCRSYYFSTMLSTAKAVRGAHFSQRVASIKILRRDQRHYLSTSSSSPSTALTSEQPLMTDGANNTVCSILSASDTHRQTVRHTYNRYSYMNVYTI